MRTDWLLQRDKLSSHTPTWDAVGVDVLVQMYRDIDHRSVRNLLCDCAAVVVLVVWLRDGNGRSMARRCVWRWRKQRQHLGLVVLERPVGLLAHDDILVELVGAEYSKPSIEIEGEG
jgi:hypothetical protein